MPELRGMMQSYKHKPSVVLREIHGIYFLIDTSAQVENDACVIYQLDPLGALLWQELKEKTTLATLVQAVQKACVDAPDDSALQKDVTEFLELLTEKGFLIYDG